MVVDPTVETWYAPGCVDADVLPRLPLDDDCPWHGTNDVFSQPPIVDASALFAVEPYAVLLGHDLRFGTRDPHLLHSAGLAFAASSSLETWFLGRERTLRTWCPDPLTVAAVHSHAGVSLLAMDWRSPLGPCDCAVASRSLGGGRCVFCCNSLLLCFTKPFAIFLPETDN